MRSRTRDTDREDRLFLLKRALVLAQPVHCDDQAVAETEMQTAAPPSSEKPAVTPNNKNNFRHPSEGRHDASEQRGRREKSSTEAEHRPDGGARLQRAGLALLMCHSTRQQEPEVRAWRRRRRGGRRGDTRRAAHKAAYEARTAAMRAGSPPARPKEAPGVQHAICINTAPGGVIEFTADGSDAVLGKIEINAHGIIGEVDAPDGQGEKLISAGVEAAKGGRVHALAERLKHIRRQAPVLHRWSLYKSGLT